MKQPFCFNDQCELHEVEIDRNVQVHGAGDRIRISGPDGDVIDVSRHRYIDTKTRAETFFCGCCHHAIEMTIKKP